MNPQVPRLRIGAAAPSRAPWPNRISAFEKVVRCFAEIPAKNVITPALGTTLDSLGEADDFYNLYSWEKGFGIRYGKSRLNVERTKCVQEIVCGCSMRTTVLEEVNDINVPMEPLHYPVVATIADQLPPMAGASADGWICAVDGAVDAEINGLPQAYEQSVGQMDPKAPRWTRRLRICAAPPGRMPCPNRASALEKAIRGFAENPGDNVIVPALGASFDTLGEDYIRIIHVEL